MCKLFSPDHSVHLSLYSRLGMSQVTCDGSREYLSRYCSGEVITEMSSKRRPVSSDRKASYIHGQRGSEWVRGSRLSVLSGSNPRSPFQVSGSLFFPLNVPPQKKLGNKVNSADVITHQHIQLNFVFGFSSITLVIIVYFRTVMGALVLTLGLKGPELVSFCECYYVPRRIPPHTTVLVVSFAAINSQGRSYLATQDTCFR